MSRFQLLPQTRWTAVHLSACSLLTLAALSPALAEPKKSVEIPTVDVTQSKPKAAKTAAKKAQPKPAVVDTTPQAPAATEANADTPVAPGTRSGSLGQPTTAEAKAEIERTPGGVDIVPGSEYQKTGPAMTIKDALDYVPGVFVQPKWGDDTRLSIRGSGLSRNFHGRGVELLVDGIIPITTADGAGDFQEIDPSAYEYIEVYKGTNALRFGANQLGGAINFVTPTGYNSELFGLRLDFGSFGYKRAAVTSGGVSGKVDYFASVSAQEQDGFRDHSSGESVRAAFNLGYKITPDVETRFYIFANDINQKIPGAVKKQQALSNPKGAFEIPGITVSATSRGDDNVDRDYERNLETYRFANRTTIRLTPGSMLEIGGFYFNRHLDHPINPVIDNEHNEYGGFARLVSEGSIGGFKNRLTTGTSLHYGDVLARTYFNDLGNRGRLLGASDQNSSTATIYIEDQVYVVPNFALVAGGQQVYAGRQREDLLNPSLSLGRDYGFFTPKGGFIWETSASSQIFGNISRSGEAPTLSEVTTARILEPQMATTYELGTRGSFTGFKWDLAVYRMNLENEFQCLSSGNQGTCTQINLDRTIHQGVEAGIAARLFSGLFERGGRADEIWLNGAYTFSDFRFDNDVNFGDNQLPGAPRHFLRAELLYKHPSGFYAGPNVEWVPEAYYVDSANTLDTEAYAIWGMKAGFDNGGPVSAYIEARNLEDEAYIASASIAQRANPVNSPTANNFFEPGTGRAIYGGVQFKW